ncbi:MAG: NeuB family protein [Candidatus Magasanikbacteria bacterium GW2011_GWC2_45_8]|uniref:NeuB family protein n=1 Tax=Candidatus Magasanikbacteria bacterium GW2011_GWC2_45_8 TaxID=1619050 RepID=A0A0G1MZR4_9BACT|nr:MAG: NeuB family protein [Candidatus Magasanikbacteria bacterium GW2011_GWC2_45_8]
MLVKTNRTTIVCEMSQTYEGSYDIASALVKAAVDAKADAIKFQVFLADELATKDYQHYDLFKRLELTPDQWGSLILQAHEGGILALADVFGVESAKILLERGIDGFKIHATDVKNTPLLEFLAKTGRPLLLSVGGSHLEEIKRAVETLQSCEAKDIILMHGFQSYPTLVEDTFLNKMSLWAHTLNLPVGFADHIAGDHHLRYELCGVAIGKGACLVEKHITSDRLLKMEDYESALNPAEFKEFVEHIRGLDRALGPEALNLSPTEEKYRKGTKKHIVAGRDLPSGSTIREIDIAMKRTAEEYDFIDREDVVDKILRQEIKKDQVIRLENLA